MKFLESLAITCTACFMASFMVLANLGCANTTNTTAGLQQPESNSARIYVIRNDYLSSDERIEVRLDGKVQAQLRAGQYWMAQVPANEYYKVSAAAENDSTVRIKADAGQHHFLRLATSHGAMGIRIKLQEIDGDAGKAALLTTQPAQKL